MRGGGFVTRTVMAIVLALALAPLSGVRAEQGTGNGLNGATTAGEPVADVRALPPEHDQTAALLRALRDARTAQSEEPGSTQALSDLLTALADMADQALRMGDHRAAALLGAELYIQGAGAPPEIPSLWQEGALIHAQALLTAGHPVEAIVRASPAWNAPEGTGSDRATGLTDALDSGFDTMADTLAGPEGDPDAIVEAWLAAADQREAAIAEEDARFDSLMAPVLDALGAGNAAAADTAARLALASVRADDPLVVNAYAALLGAALRHGRRDLAEPWAVRLAEMPPLYLAGLPVDLAPVLSDLAEALSSEGRHANAVTLAEAATVLTPLQGGDVVEAQRVLGALAQVYRDAGRLADAADAFDRTLVGTVENAPAGLAAHVLIAARVGRALLRLDRGDPAGAEDDLLRAADLLRNTDAGQDGAARAHVAMALADLYLAQDRATEAGTMLAAALATPALADSPARSTLLFAQARAQLAIGDAQGALLSAEAAASALSSDDPLQVRILVLRAAAIRAAGTPGDEQDLARQLVAEGEGARLALAEAASAAAARGDRAGALQFMELALEAMAPADPMLPLFTGGKAGLLLADGRSGEALPLFRQSTAALTAADRRDEPGARMHLPGHVAAALDMLDRAATPGEHMTRFTEAFQVAQRVNDLSAGAALGQASARWLARVPGAADLAREREAAERALASARATYRLALADGGNTDAARRALADAGARIDQVRAEVDRAFPEYAALADPRPTDLVSTMRRLGPDEVLVLFATADTPPGMPPQSHVFALTDAGYLAAPLPPRAEVLAMARGLRCAAALTDRQCAGRAGGTRGAFSIELDGDDDAAGDQGLAFDFALAHRVWVDLLEPVSDAFAGKTSLIVVPDKALAALPFHLALTGPAAPGTGFQDAPWLIRRMAVTVVPSVASLAALRSPDARASVADLPFLGIGDPLIGAQAAGPLPYDCGAPPAAALYAAALAPPARPILRGAQADVAALTALSALPDTRCELDRNAHLLGAPGSVLLQGDATETRIKALSQTGDLARYRVLSFATHGLIAGEVGAANAGLVLTPPSHPDPLDDGLLTIAEIADLRLDADFVLLSACNTAAGSAEADEGYAGLASAFFIAGARSLLVSHWPVYSDAATDLTTGLMTAMAAPDRPSRSEALRRAMLAILDDPASTPRRLHPAYWAPFAMLGDTVLVPQN